MMKNIIILVIITIFTSTVQSNEFIDRMREQSKEYNNCQFKVETIGKYYSPFNNELDARRIEIDRALGMISSRRPGSSPPHPDILKKNIIGNTKSKLLEGTEKGYTNVYHIKDLINYTKYIYDQNGKLIQGLIFLEDGEASFDQEIDQISVRERTPSIRGSVIFAHDFLLKDDFDNNFQVKYIDQPESDFEVVTDKANQWATRYEIIYQSNKDYFPVQINYIYRYGKSESIFCDFQDFDGKQIPTKITYKQYELISGSNEFFLDTERIRIIKDFQFKEQEIDWLVPPGLRVQNDRGMNIFTEEPILASELINQILE